VGYDFQLRVDMSLRQRVLILDLECSGKILFPVTVKGASFEIVEAKAVVNGLI
jgi:hypothetical protein